MLACRPAPVAVTSADPARGSDYVEATNEPSPEPAVATAAAPQAEASPRMFAQEVDGAYDELVTGERMRAEYGAGDPWLGAERPTVTIVAFLDYQCPYSKRLLPSLYELVELYPEDLRVVFKHHPLAMHKDARFAATAAIAAGRQGRFWAMHDALFEDQHRLDRASVLDTAGRLGFDLRRFEADLEDSSIAAAVDADVGQSTRLGMRGTPAMFINGRMLSGARPLPELRQEIQSELELAGRMMDAGAQRAHLYAHFMHAALMEAAGAKPSARPDQIADDVRREVSTAGLPRRGAADPRVTIVVCSDFDCPFCSRVRSTLDELLADHPDDVALFYRHLPLPFHKGAEPAARAATAAHAQGKFWKMHDLLFDNQKKRTDADLEKLARKAGVDVKKWRKAFQSEAVAAEVAAQSAACSANDVRGTPGFLVNGRLLSGARPLADFEQVIQEELRRGR